MSEQSRPSMPETEEELVALLASLKVEYTNEADFEGRFLAEFHERVAREAVCCPARRHLLAHVLQMLDNFGRGRLAFGASAMGVVLLAVAFAVYPTETTRVDTAATVAGERYLSPLQMPALSSDLVDCTSVRVNQPVSVFDNNGITVARGQHSTIIQIPNVYVPIQKGGDAAVPGGRSATVPVLPSSSVRYAF